MLRVINDMKFLNVQLLDIYFSKHNTGNVIQHVWHLVKHVNIKICKVHDYLQLNIMLANLSIEQS